MISQISPHTTRGSLIPNSVLSHARHLSAQRGADFVDDIQIFRNPADVAWTAVAQNLGADDLGLPDGKRQQDCNLIQHLTRIVDAMVHKDEGLVLVFHQRQQIFPKLSAGLFVDG
jgi:hypothetical protein